MRPLDQHWLVRLDVREAYRWYERKQKGVGRRFNRELRSMLKRLSEGVVEYAVRFDDIRRANLPTFPYGVYYFLADDAVVVIGVLHNGRDSRDELERRRQKYS